MSDKYAALRASITAAIEKVEAAHEATERTSVARREGLVRAHKMYQQERDRAEAAEKRVAELLAELDADKRRIEELTEAEQNVKTLESRNRRLSGIIDAAEGRISELRLALSRYSMSAGQADQRKAESNAVRTELGFDPDAEDVAPVDLCEGIQALKTRIAELEARTLTVKLPPEVQGSNIPFAADGANAMRKEVVKALTYACAAAGISLKIEGE